MFTIHRAAPIALLAVASLVGCKASEAPTTSGFTESGRRAHMRQTPSTMTDSTWRDPKPWST